MVKGRQNLLQLKVVHWMMEKRRKFNSANPLLLEF
jgi:hypothetical protein